MKKNKCFSFMCLSVGAYYLTNTLINYINIIATLQLQREHQQLEYQEKNKEPIGFKGE